MVETYRVEPPTSVRPKNFGSGPRFQAPLPESLALETPRAPGRACMWPERDLVA